MAESESEKQIEELKVEVGTNQGVCDNVVQCDSKIISPGEKQEGGEVENCQSIAGPEDSKHV